MLSWRPSPSRGCFPKKTVTVLVVREGAVKIGVSGLSTVMGRPWTGAAVAAVGRLAEAVSAAGLLEWLFFLARGCAPRAGPGHCLHSPHCKSAARDLGSKRGRTSYDAIGAIGFQGASWLPESTTPSCVLSILPRLCTHLCMC